MTEKIKQNTLSIGRSQSLKITLLTLFIIASCLTAYTPALRGGFIWDDDAYVTKNPLLSAPDGLFRIWFSQDQPSQYFPMVYTMFRLEYQLWGLEPFGYHLVNIILHIINALLLWYLLSQLGVGGSWIAAAIFALHPVHVESVAWITERKNVLSTFFSLLTIIAWIKFVHRSHRCQLSWPFYFLSLLLFALALLSKTTVCTLIIPIILLPWVERIELNAKRWLQILPYFLLGLVMGIIAMWWEYGRGSSMGVLDLNYIERLLLACRAVFFYLGKLIWPVSLTFSYPKWNINATQPLQYIWFLACLVLAFCVWRWRERIGRKTVLAIVFFVTTLLPVLGFLSLYTFYYTYVADHYQYMASIGPIALVAAAIYEVIYHLKKRMKYVISTMVFCILVILGTLTWQQCHIYKDIETLWRDTLKKNPQSYMAHTNLGVFLSSQGKYDEAISHYRTALKIRPNDEAVHNALGMALKLQGKLDEAIHHHMKAIELVPNYAPAYRSLAAALKSQGKFEQAGACYRIALQITPDDFKTHYNFGNMLLQQNKLNEAVDCYRKTLSINPDFFEAQTNLGIALESQGRLDEAIDCYRKSLQINPDDLLTRKNLGRLLVLRGKSDEAAVHFEQVVRLASDEAKGYYEVGIILSTAGQQDSALGYFQKAASRDPNWTEPLIQSARILSTSRNPKLRNTARAIELVKQAAEITRYQDAEIIRILAMTYAADNQVGLAITTAEQALDKAVSDKNYELADIIKKQLKFYKSNKPRN